MSLVGTDERQVSERMPRVKQLLPLMIVLAALVVVETPARAQEPTAGQAATTNVASSSDDQYEPMGAGDAADDAARQAKSSFSDGAASYASALGAARDTEADERVVVDTDPAAAATSDNNVSSAPRADRHVKLNEQNSNPSADTAASDQYPKPPDQDGGAPTTQAARDAAEEAASSAKESSEKDAAAYAAALEAARSTGASETAASIAATEAVADTEDNDTDTGSGEAAKDSPDIEVLPATGGASLLLPVVGSLMIAGGLIAGRISGRHPG